MLHATKFEYGTFDIVAFMISLHFNIGLVETGLFDRVDLRI